MDTSSSRPGDSFAHVLRRVIEGCRVMVAVIGPDWVGESSQGRRIDDPDDIVRLELTWAEEAGAVVIPVCVAGRSLADLVLPEPLNWLTTRQVFEISKANPQRDCRALAKEIAERSGLRFAPKETADPRSHVEPHIGTVIEGDVEVEGIAVFGGTVNEPVVKESGHG